MRSTNSPSPTGAARPPASVSTLRWVILSVLGWQAGTFIFGLIGLSATAGSINNKFRDLALDRYWWYLIWINLEIFLKAYLPAGVGLVLVVYPAVRGWLSRRVRIRRRWSVIWRTLALVSVLTVLFSAVMLHLRPWMLSGTGAQWYSAIRDFVPVSLRGAGAFALDATPWVIAALTVFYYAAALLRRGVPRWSATARIGAAAACVGMLGAGCWAVPAWQQRINAKPRADSRPNVLILASDSFRSDHVSANGYHRPTTPAIDELAAHGINFTKCFTPIASTVESLTSIMSSQYPHTHGLQHMFPNKDQVARVKERAPAFARLMRDQGYDTAVMGDWCAGVFDMLPMGFEKVDATTFDNFKVYMSQAVYMAHPVLPLYFDNPLGYWLFPRLESSAFYVTPEVVTERVVDRLAAQSHSKKPFCWTVFYSCTHIPYTAGPGYNRLFTDPAYKGEHKHQFAFNVDEWVQSVDISKKWQAMPEADVQQIIGLYDGCVRKFDDCIRKVVDELKRTGQFDNTIILVTADHGDDLMEPNCTFGHGLTFNGGDQNTHIPAVFYVPGLKDRPRTVSKVVRSLDFAPTLLDLCGLSADPRMEGVSLRPYVRGTADDLGLAYFGETSYLFCKRHIPGEEPHYLPAMDNTTFIDENFDCHFVLRDEFQSKVLETKERALRTNRWKLVFTPGRYYNIERLYDLKNDPHCERNVALENPEVFATMKTHLWKWIKEKKESRIPDIFPKGEPEPNKLRT